MAKVNQAVEPMAYTKPKKKMPKRRIFFIICVTVVFPLVPVTPISRILSAGWP